MKTRPKASKAPKKQAAARPRPARTRAGSASKRSAAPAPRKAKAAARKPTAIAAKAQSAALAADCTIAQAAAIKAKLARALASASPVTLDLSEVRRIDTAGLQVLATFIRERRSAGREVQCEGATESFLLTAQLLGLGALFAPVIDDRLAAPAAGNA